MKAGGWLAVALLACAPWWPAQAGRAAELPLTLFAAHADFEEVRLSPNGDYVAAVMRDDERSQLVVLRTSSLEISLRLQLPVRQHVDDVWWASPRRLVVSAAVQSDSWARPRRSGELFAVDADGKNQRYLSGDRDGQIDRAFAWMVDPLVDDDHHVLVRLEHHRSRDAGEAMSAYKLDVDSGSRVRVATAPIKGQATFAADARGHVAYVTVIDAAGQQHLFWRADEAADWTELPMPPGLRVEVERVLADGSVLYRDTSAGEPQRHCLVRRAAGRVQGGVELGCSRSRSAVLYSFDQREPIALRVYEGPRPQLQYLAGPPHPDRLLLQALERDLGSGSALFLGYTHDGSRALVKVMNDRDPGRYYLFDRAHNRASQLLSSREKIDPARMSPRRPIKLPAGAESDAAFLTLPIATQGKPPLVVKLRGVYGANAGWTWDADSQALASRGYAVLDIDNYDSEARRHRTPRAGEPDPALGLAAALIQNLDWLGQQNQIDATRICIHGDSYGAYIALTAATLAPSRFRCVVSEAGIVDIDAWRQDTLLSETAYGRSLMAMYMSGVGTDVSSPLRRIGSLQAPLLLIHGRLDATVPYAQASLLMKALDRERRPYEQYIENDEAHGFYRQAHRIRRYERLLAFFDRHLGPIAATAP